MMSWKGALTSMALVCAWAGCGEPDAVGTHMIVNPATASTVEVETQRPTLAFADTLMEFGVVSEGTWWSMCFRSRTKDLATLCSPT